MNDPRENQRAAWLVRQWTTALAKLIESMAGEPPRVEWQPAPPGADLALQAAALAARHGTVLWWEQSFSAAPDAHFWVGAPESAWSPLGARILNAAGVEEAGPEEARGTWLELLGQSLDQLAGAVGSQLRREVTCPDRNERTNPPPAAEFFTVELQLGETALPPLLAVPGDSLSGVLADPPQPAAGETSLAPVAPGAAVPAPAAPNRMLDLLLDVELPVAISFGRTHLPLKETLRLTTGSIVELNRAVTEPVDVIVNNCVIARGEVVVIEGNYGVRIREIVSRQERLRNLR